MSNIEPGQAWEVYSQPEGRWVRMIVAKVEGETVTFRYEGLLELMTIETKELRDKPHVYRPVEPAAGPVPT